MKAWRLTSGTIGPRSGKSGLWAMGHGGGGHGGSGTLRPTRTQGWGWGGVGRAGSLGRMALHPKTGQGRFLGRGLRGGGHRNCGRRGRDGGLWWGGAEIGRHVFVLSPLVAATGIGRRPRAPVLIAGRVWPPSATVAPTVAVGR